MPDTELLTCGSFLSSADRNVVLQLGPAVGAVFASTGEYQEAAVRQVHENLALLEAELRDGAFRGRRYFGGDEVGLLDVVLGYGSY